MHRKMSRRRGCATSLEPLETRKLLASGIGAFTPANATWSLRSTASAGPADVGTFQFGALLPVTGDWNGDGKDDIGTFNPLNATWSLRYGASAGAPDAGVFVFGAKGSLPVVGDWNADGRDDIGVYAPGTATWSLRLGASAGPANAVFKFGAKNALPVAGDWNGDGRDGIGTFESGSFTWTLRQTATPGAADAGTFKFGVKNTYPVVGDWDGDKKDGIGVVATSAAIWGLRQTATPGVADAGTFVFGPTNAIPVTGDWKGPAPTANTLTSVTLKPLDLNVLGLEVQTSPITFTVSAKSGDGKLLGNLLNSVGNIVSTSQTSAALNTVLGTAADLLNGGNLSVGGIGAGSFDTRPVANAQVLELFVAPVHLDTLGVQVDVSPVRLSISAHSGAGLVLGNVMSDLSKLFNPPLPATLDVDTLNQKLSDLLGAVNAALPGIPAANVPTTQPNADNVLRFAVPALDLNLLGLNLITDPVVIDASARPAIGHLLGNVWSAALNTLNATPDKVAQINNTVNGVLAKVIGALNASSLNLAPATVAALPPAVQTLLSPTLFAPAGSSAPILDLTLSATSSGAPAAVDLLGLNVAGNNVNAHLSAVTGDGQILGNLLYNAANLTNTASPSALALIQALATNNLGFTGTVTGQLTGATPAPADLYTVTLPPLDLDLLGMDLQTDPITVHFTAHFGDGRLLGNVLRGYTSLLNLNGVSSAVNNVLGTVVGLANSTNLSVQGVGSGAFDTAGSSTTQILDTTVAPIDVDVLGAEAHTSPIHLKLIAQSGNGLVLGNALTQAANLFNPPLPATLDFSQLNAQLQQTLSQLNAQIPGIAPAALPAASADPGSVLGLTVPGINLDLLGMGLKFDPIVVGAAAHSGDGQLLGNVYTALLNTMDVTTADLSGVTANVNALMAKVVGVFNASTITLPAGALGSLPPAYQALALPNLVTATPGATASILDLGLASPTGSQPPTSASLLGLTETTSSVHLTLTAHTGDGLILGNMLYNVSNLLNAGGSSNYLYLLSLLA